jgi:hypothetical protein
MRDKKNIVNYELTMFFVRGFIKSTMSYQHVLEFVIKL